LAGSLAAYDLCTTTSEAASDTVSLGTVASRLWMTAPDAAASGGIGVSKWPAQRGGSRLDAAASPLLPRERFLVITVSWCPQREHLKDIF